MGTIVAGTLKKGTLTPNMTLLMGPDIEGGLFKPVSIKSIHYKRMPVTHVVAGQTAALALKKTKKNQVGQPLLAAEVSLPWQVATLPCWHLLLLPHAHDSSVLLVV